MKKIFAKLVLFSCCFSAFAQNPFQTSDWITDGVFTQGVEGPAVDKAGNLYAVNYQQQGTIGKVIGKGQVQTLLTLDKGSIGNGIRFDAQGNMYIADYVNHNVLKVPVTALASGKDVSTHVAVFAHNNDMNQPNDLAIMDNGILFASDPNWSNNTGKLWRIDTHGNTLLLEDEMGTTNGIAVSPNNKTLYVNESVQRRVWRYDLDEKGNVSNKQLLIRFFDHGLDGMRTDELGNLYIARYGAGSVAIVSPNGKLLREVKLTGKHPTNVAFGGAGGKTVFVTMQKRGAIEMFRTNIDLMQR